LGCAGCREKRSSREARQPRWREHVMIGVGNRTTCAKVCRFRMLRLGSDAATSLASALARASGSLLAPGPEHEGRVDGQDRDTDLRVLLFACDDRTRRSWPGLAMAAEAAEEPLPTRPARLQVLLKLRRVVFSRSSTNCFMSAVLCPASTAEFLLQFHGVDEQSHAIDHRTRIHSRRRGR